MRPDWRAAAQVKCWPQAPLPRATHKAKRLLISAGQRGDFVSRREILSSHASTSQRVWARFSDSVIGT